ncbi:hypothetical protein [Fastidiosibacter lacustris]|uniref:hypothetical protein n=1 Tax=Fastidiosibacter lacustris TaxID=2056695 RepID=UPI000E34D64A|nr:hypothetical protein [Fastidiosibacter lacustris]
MKRGIILLLTILSLHAYGNDYGSDNGNNMYGNTPATSATNNSSNNNNNAQGNQQLLQEMNKKTSKGLKVFDKLLRDDGQSKEDFLADVGQNPTADQFEGGDSSGGRVENPFAKILGADAQSNQ